MKIKLNKNIARKVLKTVDAGLSKGLGKPKPGQMCVEAAVNFALGLPHGDSPKSAKTLDEAKLAYAYAYAYTRELIIKKFGEDYFLKLAADICLQALIELESPGCKWLSLCDSVPLKNQ